MALRHKHLFHRFPLFQRAVFSSVSSTQRLSHEDIRTYENLIKEKLKKSEMVTSTDYHPLLQGYRLLTLPFEGKRLYNEMIQNYIEPDVGCYHELLGCYSLENQPIETEKMFREIWKKIPSDIKLLNILLHSYCHAGQPAHAERIFHEFAVQVTPTVISYGTLLSGYVKIGEPVEAIRIHQEMMRVGHPPSQVSYSTLITACIKKKLPQLGESLLEEMLFSHRLRPSLSVYTSLIDSYAQLCLLSDAERLLTVMEKKYSLIPNQITYTTLLKGYATAARYDDVRRVYQLFETNYDKPHDISTYVSLIGIVSSPCPELAEFFLTKMTERSHQPSLQSYTAVIRGYCFHKKPAEAEKIRKLIPSQMLPKMDPSVYRTIFSSYLNSDQPQEAEGYLSLGHFQPTQKLLDLLSRGYADKNLPMEGERVLNQLTSQGKKPSIDSYIQLIQSHCRLNQPSSGEKLSNEMIKYGYATPPLIYLTLMTTYAHNPRYACDSERMMSLMKTNGHSIPPSAYFNVIRAYTLSPLPHHAERVLQKMLDDDKTPDIRCYGLVINAYCLASEPGQGERLFRKILQEGYEANLITYNTLLQGYCANGQPHEAERILREMLFSNAFGGDVVSFTTVISGFCHQGLMSDAERLYQEMITRKISPNEITFNFLIGGFLTQDQPEKAMEHLRTMVAMGRRQGQGERQIIPKHETYHSLLVYYSKKANREKVQEIISLLKDAFPLTSPVSSSSSSFSPSQPPPAPLPDSALYHGTLFNIFIRLGEPRKGFEILKLMSSHGLPVNTSLYYRLLTCHVSLAQPLECLEILQHMKEKRLRWNHEVIREVCQLLRDRGLEKESQELQSEAKEYLPEVSSVRSLLRKEQQASQQGQQQGQGQVQGGGQQQREGRGRESHKRTGRRGGSVP